jgi:hypothetical protein
MTTPEKRSLGAVWPDANVVDRTVSLGTPIGRGVTGDDVSDRGFQRVGERLKMFNRAFMSWTMRVLAVNVFVLSLVSYSNRIFLMSPDRIAHLTNQALRFITPVPFCSYKILSHCATLNRTGNALRDPLFDNISAVLSTAYMLQRRGAVDTNQVHNLQQEIVRICSDELVPVNNLISAPSPLHHFVVAANMFRRITGCTPDMYIQQLGSRHPPPG